MPFSVLLVWNAAACVLTVRGSDLTASNGALTIAFAPPARGQRRRRIAGFRDGAIPDGAANEHSPSQPKVLSDDSSLLHQRPSSHRTHLFDDRCGCDPALQAHEGTSDVHDHWRGRARRQRRAVGAKGGVVTGIFHGNIRAVEAAVGRTGDSRRRFIRTTDEKHHRTVQWLFKRCRDNGFIVKGHYTGQYCVHDNAYVVDAGPGDACPDCGRPTETVTEENYFFKLSEFRWKPSISMRPTPISSSRRAAGTKF